MRPSRNGLTFIELCVSACLLVVILGTLAYTASGARRGEALASLHLGLMENVALAMHQLRTDLRQISFVPGKPVLDYSIAIAPDFRAVKLRRSSTGVSVGPLGSSFIIVEYRLVPSDRPGRFHLMRIESTASGVNLPGKSVPREERLFRSFSLLDASFLYQEQDDKDVRVLHVAFRVVTDSGPTESWGPFRDKELLLTNVLSVLRPEAPFAYPTLWANAVQVPAEIPPGDVLAPEADDSGKLD